MNWSTNWGKIQVRWSRLVSGVQTRTSWSVLSLLTRTSWSVLRLLTRSCLCRSGLFAVFWWRVPAAASDPVRVLFGYIPTTQTFPGESKENCFLSQLVQELGLLKPDVLEADWFLNDLLEDADFVSWNVNSLFYTQAKVSVAAKLAATDS